MSFGNYAIWEVTVQTKLKLRFLFPEKHVYNVDFGQHLLRF